MDTEALKKSLLKKFQEVTADRLQKIQLGVLDLEKPGSERAADDVARELHTMKGEARMLGLAAIGQMAHAQEDLLKSFREGKTPARVATDLLLHACDALQGLVEDLPAAETGTPATAEMCKNLAAASGHPIPELMLGGGSFPSKRKPAPAPAAATPAPAATPAEPRPPEVR